MPFFKVVFVYSQPVNKGFTEVFYREATTLQRAAQFDTDFTNYNLAIRNPLTIWRKCRVSSVDGNRQSVVVPINKNKTPAGYFGPPDITSTAAVCILSSSQFGTNRRIWLRGLDDNSTLRDQASGADAPNATWIVQLNMLIRAYWSSSFCVRSLVPLGQPPNVYTPIANITGAVGDGKITIGTTGVNPPLPRTRVIVSQMNAKYYPGLNGHYNVLSSTPTGFQIAYNLVNVPQAAEKTGRWRPEAYNYGYIDKPPASGFDHFGSRDTGAGFSPGRGRRRAVHLRSL